VGSSSGTPAAASSTPATAGGSSSGGGTAAAVATATAEAPKASLLSKHDDWVPKLVDALSIILSITEAVYDALEMLLKYQDMFDKKARDNLNLSALIVDNTVINIVTTIIVAIQTVKSSKIELSANGDIVLEAAKEQKFYAIQSEEAASPSSTTKEWVYNLQLAAQLGQGGKLLFDMGKSIYDFVVPSTEEPPAEVL
jgi:hypothetical protein